MPLIFHTPRDFPYDMEIGGVGILGASAKGGIPVERAALVAQELQDDSGKPLTGKSLKSAAEKFAEARGLAVKSLKTIDEEKLRVDAGAFPIGKSIEQISREVAQRDVDQTEAHLASSYASPLTAAELPIQDTTILPQPPGQEG